MSPVDLSEEQITLSAVGDICLGLKLRSETPLQKVEFPFEQIKNELVDSDLRFGNLEYVIIKKEMAKQRKSDLWNCDSSVKSLEDCKFDVMSFANNHIMDFGETGFKHTINTIRNSNIQLVGAGSNKDDARKPVVKKIKNLKIGFLGYADNEGQIAKQNKVGAAEARLQFIAEDLKTIKRDVDVIIISLHMGIEFTHHPSPYMIKLSRMLIDLGADIILGHHPHVLQGIETYNKGLICYSLGNFIFQVHDEVYQSQGLPYSAWGIIVKIRINKNGYVSHKIIPTIIKKDNRVRLAENDDANKILNHIKKISTPLNNEILIERNYQKACRKFAKINYIWFKSDLFYGGGIFAFFKRVIMMATRASNRRWIAGFWRSLTKPLYL